jgi:hypothetical protein
MLSHRFAWTHVAPECFDCCEHLEHWEARCVYCGELETVEAAASPCEAREATEGQLEVAS